MDQIELAKKFASDKFREAGKENHYLDVFQIAKADLGVTDVEVLAAAILHDVLEDTRTTYKEIEMNFSKRVADLVEEVSHPPNYSSEQRETYYQKIKHISSDAKLIKMADFASNLKSFIGIYERNEQHQFPKFVNNDKYITSIREFLDNCTGLPGNSLVYGLTEKLETLL